MKKKLLINEQFNNKINTHWTQVIAGGAYVIITDSGLRLGYPGASDKAYTDAQIDDYTMVAKKDYKWQAPLRMTVRARFSDNGDSLKGTAGFGFWNKPFTMQGNWFTLPQSVWFFYSAPPSNMALVTGIKGWGWKAQVVNTRLWRCVLLAIPTAAAAMYSRVLQKNIRGTSFQKFTGAAEKLVNQEMSSWHTYTIDWHKNKVVFSIDGKQVMETHESPKKAMGFVAWIDNEYAYVNCRGELGFGKTDAGDQWMDIEYIKITSDIA